MTEPRAHAGPGPRAHLPPHGGASDFVPKDENEEMKSPILCRCKTSPNTKSKCLLTGADLNG